MNITSNINFEFKYLIQSKNAQQLASEGRQRDGPSEQIAIRSWWWQAPPLILCQWPAAAPGPSEPGRWPHTKESRRHAEAQDAWHEPEHGCWNRRGSLPTKQPCISPGLRWPQGSPRRPPGPPAGRSAAPVGAAIAATTTPELHECLI